MISVLWCLSLFFADCCETFHCTSSYRVNSIRSKDKPRVTGWISSVWCSSSSNPTRNLSWTGSVVSWHWPVHRCTPPLNSAAPVCQSTTTPMGLDCSLFHLYGSSCWVLCWTIMCRCSPRSGKDPPANGERILQSSATCFVRSRRDPW